MVDRSRDRGDTGYEIASGNVPGSSFVHKFGANGNVGTTLVPICQGAFYRTPTSTVTLTVISDDANDTAAGTGAQEITIQYLDSNWDLQTATLETNGTSEGDTQAGVLRLLRAYVSRSGTYATQSAASQAGQLTIRVSGAGDTWAVIPEPYTGWGIGQSLIGCYTVPNGYTAYIMSSEITVDSNKTVDVFLYKRENADDTSSPYTGTLRMQNLYIGLSGSHSFEHKTYESFPAKTDLMWMAYAASTSDVSVEFELLLVEDGY